MRIKIESKLKIDNPEAMIGNSRASASILRIIARHGLKAIAPSNRWLPVTRSIYTHPNGNQGPWADVSFDRPGPTTESNALPEISLIKR